MSKVNVFGSYPKAHITAYHSADQTIGNSVLTNLTFDSEATGNEATYNITHSPATTFTIAGGDGWYIVTYQISIDRNVGGNSREATVSINAGVKPQELLFNSPPISAGLYRQILRASAPVYLENGDNLILRVYQNSGSTLKVYNGRAATYFKILKEH